MNKQIEEMAKDIENAKRDIWASVVTREEDEDYLWHSRRIAEHLTNLGYQKVDKDKEIVITKEEFNQIHANFFVSGIEHGRNETAREILKEFLKEFVVYTCVGDYYTETEINNKIQELAKQYGVEIKE